MQPKVPPTSDGLIECDACGVMYAEGEGYIHVGGRWHVCSKSCMRTLIVHGVRRPEPGSPEKSIDSASSESRAPVETTIAMLRHWIHQIKLGASIPDMRPADDVRHEMERHVEQRLKREPGPNSCPAPVVEDDNLIDDVRDVLEYPQSDWESRTDLGGKLQIYVAKLVAENTALRDRLEATPDGSAETGAEARMRVALTTILHHSSGECSHGNASDCFETITHCARVGLQGIASASRAGSAVVTNISGIGTDTVKLVTEDDLKGFEKVPLDGEE